MRRAPSPPLRPARSPRSARCPGTIMDRSVVVDLARRKPDEKIEAFRLDRTAALDEIARRIVRWAEDYADAVAARRS